MMLADAPRYVRKKKESGQEEAGDDVLGFFQSNLQV